MTGLPFIYAAWTGRPGAVDRRRRRARCRRRRREGVAPSMRLRRNTARGDAGAGPRGPRAT